MKKSKEFVRLHQGALALTCGILFALCMLLLVFELRYGALPGAPVFGELGAVSGIFMIVNGFINGAIGGWIFAWLYNTLAAKIN